MPFISSDRIFRPYGISRPLTYSKVPLLGRTLFPITRASDPYHCDGRWATHYLVLWAGPEALIVTVMRNRGDCRLYLYNSTFILPSL